MNWWVSAIVAGFVIFIASRGGLPALLTVGKTLLPFVLFFLAVKHITLLIFPDKKEKKRVSSRDEDNDDPNVIRICGQCGKEEGACLRCKVGFPPKK